MTQIPTKGHGDFQLPALGLGTSTGGKSVEEFKARKSQFITGIRAALERGFTHIDTSEHYADGLSETFVGEAIRGYDRKDLFLTTKVWSDHLGYRDLIEAASQSLDRLGVDCVDLYLIHQPNPAIKIADTIEAMDTLIHMGMTRFIGVSKFNATLLAEAQCRARHHLVNNQVSYQLDDRRYEKDGTLEYCAQNNVLVTAYRPLSKGALASQNHPLLVALARKYSKTMAQIALNWVMSHQNIATIVRSSNPAHMEENLGALGWDLELEDQTLLEERFGTQS